MPEQIEQNLVPIDRARTEIRVLNSRFVACVAPTTTVELARSFIDEIRAELSDASHHVYAYIIGHGATTTLGMSDDGEPSGTAGRPTMAVLRGSGLGDVTLVITRYFGGTLLGTGGLVRAYSDAARAVLAIVGREPKIERRTLLIEVPYAAYEQARRLIDAHDGIALEETFAIDVTLRVLVPVERIIPLTSMLREVTAGQARISEEPI